MFVFICAPVVCLQFDFHLKIWMLVAMINRRCKVFKSIRRKVKHGKENQFRSACYLSRGKHAIFSAPFSSLSLSFSIYFQNETIKGLLSTLGNKLMRNDNGKKRANFGDMLTKRKREKKKCNSYYWNGFLRSSLLNDKKKRVGIVSFPIDYGLFSSAFWCRIFFLWLVDCNKPF